MPSPSINTENEQLLEDVRQVLANTEDLVSATAEQSGDKARELRQKISANLKLAKGRVLEVEKAIAGKARAAAKVTDQYVHDNPWKAIGVATGAGLLLGLLISRR